VHAWDKTEPEAHNEPPVIEMTAEIQKKRKNHGYRIVCGLFLYYLWVAVITAILFNYFAELNAMEVLIVTFPLMIWICVNVGLLFPRNGGIIFPTRPHNPIPIHG